MRSLCAIYLRAVIICVLLLCWFSFDSSAQSYFQLTRNTTRTTVPFKFYRNLIVIPVTLNGLGPYNFVLDTGVGISTITDPELIDELHLKLGRKITIRGLGNQEPAVAYLTSNIIMAMPSVQSFPLTMAVFEKDPFFLSTYLGVKVDGILGYEFFSSFTVRINYLDKVLTLFTPGSYKIKKNAESIPIQMQLNKPFIQATCGFGGDISADMSLLVDIGAGFPLSLERNSDPRIIIPYQHLDAELGMGLTGIIHGSLARTPLLQVGNFKFKDVVTSFPDLKDWEMQTDSFKRNGSVGNFLLRRFTVVFDYSNLKIYLKPNARFKDPFEYDRTGVELVGGGYDYNSFVISRVKPGSPAADAGVLPDDILLEVNFQPTKNMDLGNIDHILSNPDSRSVWLKLLRGDEEIYVLVKMRDLI